jgi:hypothetical protein
VKLFPLSVAIAVALALFFEPLSHAIPDQRCDMLGRSASQAKNCHGCCGQMKCCPIATKQQEKAQSSEPAASSRLDSGFGKILALASKDSALLYLLPGDGQKYRVLRTFSPAPATPSLAVLCIRLI